VVRAVLAHTVHDETVQMRGEQLASYIILQLCQAELDAEGLAAALGGEVARAQHPTSGMREIRDEMLGVVDAIYRPAGVTSSRFAVVEEMVAVAEMCEGSSFACLGGDAGGACIEVPFGESGTALVHIQTAPPHGWLGAGLQVATWLPLPGDEDAHARAVQALQAEQLDTFEGGGQLGAWSMRYRNGVPHTVWTRFVPNRSFERGLAVDVAMGEVNRALWVDQRLFPNLPQRDAWRVLHEREITRLSFGQGASADKGLH
jgi:hypothetical protein